MQQIQSITFDTTKNKLKNERTSVNIIFFMTNFILLLRQVILIFRRTIQRLIPTNYGKEYQSHRSISGAKNNLVKHFTNI